MKTLIQTNETTVKTASGEERTYILSKIPAIPAREIVTQYPISGMPKLGEYETNEKIMLKLMSFVGVQVEGGNIITLDTKDLVNNHVPDWETLAKLEMAMMEYNCSFFGNGKASSFLDNLAANIPQLITKILTDLSQQSSNPTKPHSKNSEASTH